MERNAIHARNDVPDSSRTPGGVYGFYCFILEKLPKSVSGSFHLEMRYGQCQSRKKIWKIVKPQAKWRQSQRSTT